MSYLQVRGLTKRFGGKHPMVAVDEVDLDIDRGEFVVLLGPSGCGKTTTLRCLAGLERADAGSISLGDDVWFDAELRRDVPPEKRNIGMVFQSYALWPHMTVEKNIGYPLRSRRSKATDPGGAIREMAEMVECGTLLPRYPSQLSGGQQQRVSLARGLVARPDLVLFDEPLSNLDAKLRDGVRVQLHELHHRLGFTAVFVTHDQTEALALADRIVVMRAGRIEQIGSPAEIFERPTSEYVADFMGMANRFELVRDGDRWSTAGLEVRGRLDVDREHSKVVARVRPDDVVVTPLEVADSGAEVSVEAQLSDVQFGGRHFDVVASVGSAAVRARVPVGDASGWARSLQRGQLVRVALPVDRAAIYDDNGDALPVSNVAILRPRQAM